MRLARSQEAISGYDPSQTVEDRETARTPLRSKKKESTCLDRACAFQFEVPLGLRERHFCVLIAKLARTTEEEFAHPGLSTRIEQRRRRENSILNKNPIR